MNQRALYITILLFCLTTEIHYTVAARPFSDTLYLTGKHQYNLKGYLEYYCDTALLPIDSVIKINNAGKFERLKKDVLNSGFSNKYYWHSLHLKNPTSLTMEIMWLFQNATVNEMKVYKVSNNRITSLGVTGDHFAFNQRPYYFYLFVYPLSLQPGEDARFYAFINKKGENLKQRFQLMDAKTLQQLQSNAYFVMGILTGILLLVFLFNVFLFYSLRDAIHGWYALYVLATLWQMLAFEGMDFQFLYPAVPSINDIAKFISCGLNLLLMLQVMQKFFNQKKENSRFLKGTIVFKTVSIFLIISCIPVYKLFHSMILKETYTLFFSVTAVLSFVLIVFSAIERVRQGFKPGYFYLFALTPLFLATIEFILNLFGVITTFDTTMGYMLSRIQLGVAFETLVISFGILYRYNLFKKEKEKLSLELEGKLFAGAGLIMSAQEMERKRIAEDLHDELGGDIAAIKINLQKATVDTERLNKVIKLLDKASGDIRSISHNLMPPDFSATPLDILLDSYYRQLNNEHGIVFQFHVNGESGKFTKEDELMIYRIIMELTNNVVKHSCATEATVQMIYCDTYLEVIVEDNGKGIPAEPNKKGIGLKNIQSRINYLDGKIIFDSNEYGTTIIIQLPYKINNGKD